MPDAPSSAVAATDDPTAVCPPDDFLVRFWGVRGSIPTPGRSTVRYGGNTPCVEMCCGTHRLVFDGGTGIRLLGQQLIQELPVEAHIFFTHSHWDHIQGFPFFTPAFIRGNTFHIYGKVAPNGASIRERLEDQMLHPNFPVPLRIMGATLIFHDLEPDAQLQIGDRVTIETGMLNHPGEATGYRVTFGGKTVVYATDTEHYPDRLDESLLHLARQADVLILDATYTDEEYWSPTSSKVGWGHSTWQEAVKLAKAAGVKFLVIFHHDPVHDDDFLDRVGAEVQACFPNSTMAVEGMVLAVQSEGVQVRLS
ncbi:MAG: MBL fold metallo-hydrolase [Pseudanabaenaceae cyanobacterium]